MAKRKSTMRSRKAGAPPVKRRRVDKRGASVAGAPAAVSEDIQQFTRFYPGSSSESLTMHTCVAISELLRETSAAQGTGLLQPGPAAGISLQLNLTQPALLTAAGAKNVVNYVSPVYDLIASAFARYRVKRCVFHYEPQSASTTPERMVFAFAEDPLHPVLWNATVPTQASLLALSDSVAFAPWRSWSMDVSGRLQDTLMYTFSDPSTTVGVFNERFSDFGVISCMTSSVSGTNTPCGVLYLELMVELVEFCPISVTNPSSVAALMKRLSVVDTKPTYRLPAEAVAEETSCALCGLLTPEQRALLGACKVCGGSPESESACRPPT